MLFTAFHAESRKLSFLSASVMPVGVVGGSGTLLSNVTVSSSGLALGAGVGACPGPWMICAIICGVTSMFSPRAMRDRMSPESAAGADSTDAGTAAAVVAAVLLRVSYGPDSAQVILAFGPYRRSMWSAFASCTACGASAAVAYFGTPVASLAMRHVELMN